jgi:hypothetical protein
MFNYTLEFDLKPIKIYIVVLYLSFLGEKLVHED